MHQVHPSAHVRALVANGSSDRGVASSEIELPSIEYRAFENF
jgi:hypothetical protein